jgi:hypothetical protein
MLEHLHRKPGAERVRTVVGDMCDGLSLVSGGYELVLVADSTLFELSSQERQLRCFQSVARLLAPGGCLVVEAVAPDVSRLERTLEAVHVGGEEVLLEATSHDPASQVVDVVSVTLGTGRVETRHRRLRYATVAELDLMGRLAGLTLEQRWGGWRREPFTAESTRHVSIYRR